MEMRVEQLSVRSGVAVDTIRYYQSKGLLDPPRREGRVAWYDDAHLDRLARIRSLQQRGFTLATIVRLIEGELDAADEALIGELSGVRRSGEAPKASPRPASPAPATSLPASAAAATSPIGSSDEVDRVPQLPGEETTFTLDELATETGVPLALLKAIEAEGLLIPERRGDHDLYTGEDVAASRAGLLLLEWGIPLSALLEVARRHHESTVAVAREAVALFSVHVRAPLRHGQDPRGTVSGPGRRPGSAADEDRRGQPVGGTPSEIEDLLSAYEQLLPAMTTLVGHHFRRALVKAALDHVEQVGSDEERRNIWEQAGVSERSGTGEQPVAPDRHAPATPR